MLLFGIIVLLFLIGVFIGREMLLCEMMNESEDKRIMYKGKIYTYTFEEEKGDKWYKVNGVKEYE